ncbi:crotonase/enoyl-CoA hydratase family protein [Delftia acidovorans]|uniref:Crotonase/enoyl-CoA hydratase family protein n=3 Tax=Pseudomonadati TaxID=3379134 RepID=A0AAJ2QW31_DELAC|nr:crotonase/enoyl-CoA hydratase family protein [Delftia acidovorans]MDX4952716.1 crotonase/enoyl-CoA hydratase family protein [Delftia acidovorans]
MSQERVRISVDHGVAEVTLARPDKMNALDPAMFDALIDALARLRDTPGLRAVVLHGEGRAFCAGLDMGSMAGIADGQQTADMTDLAARTHGMANRFQQICWGWRELPVPVIAAVHGVAYGGGLQLALGADIRLVADDARLSIMEIKWGLVPDMAGCALAAPLVRGDVLRELVYTGRIVPGPEAVALGLATRVSAAPLEEARHLARQIAASSPHAIRASKRLMQLSETASPADILLAEAQEQQALLGSSNQAEAVRAGLEKRVPVFKDQGL